MREVCNDPVSLALFWGSPSNLSAHCDWALSSIITPTSHVSFFAYVRVFLLTNILEAPFYAVVLRKQGLGKKFLGLFAANALTHPIVYFGFPIVFSRLAWTYGSYLTFSEAFAIFAEIAFIRVCFKTNSGETSVLLTLANVFSWWMGIYFSFIS